MKIHQIVCGIAPKVILAFHVLQPYPSFYTIVSRVGLVEIVNQNARNWDDLLFRNLEHDKLTVNVYQFGRVFTFVVDNS